MPLHKTLVKTHTNKNKVYEGFIVKNKETLKLTKKQKLKQKNKTANLSSGNLNKQYSAAPSLKNKRKKHFSTGQQTQGVKIIKKDKTAGLLSKIAIVCLVALVFVVSNFFALEDGGLNTIFSPNTRINGINVGNMQGMAVQQVLQQGFEQKAETFELTLKHGNDSWSFTKDDFEINSNIHTIIEEAQIRQMANMSYESQLQTVQSIAQDGSDLHVAFNYIFVGLDKKIDDIIESVSVAPVNSEIKFTPTNKTPFKITKEQNGQKVNKEALYHQINEQFIKGNKVVVSLPMVEDEPEVTKEQNELMTKKMSSFSTNVSDSTGNRKKNVELALERVNGLVVEPGQEVSFNKLTAPHTAANGYKVATIIYNGEFVDGEGGGVCQASTTLYNALLLADVQVLQVAKHTLPVRYVPLALDAMVAEGVADLKFKNNYDHSIYVRTLTTSQDVMVEIYGVGLQEGVTLKATSEIVKRLPHGGDIIKQDVKRQYTDKVVFKGEQHRLSEPRSGFVAQSYLEYYKDGKLINKKDLRTETYYPQQGVIVEGVEDPIATLEEVESNVQKQQAEKEDSEVFMFSIQNYADLPETIPTHLCP